MKRRNLNFRSATEVSSHISIIVSGADIRVLAVVSATKRKAPVLKHIPGLSVYCMACKRNTFVIWRDYRYNKYRMQTVRSHLKHGSWWNIKRDCLVTKKYVIF